MQRIKSEIGKWRKLASDNSGLALVEFAFIAPIFMTFIGAGAELSNYAIQSSQVSQLALQVADNAARIGEGDPLANKRITEMQINDLLTGAEIHAGPLNIYGTHLEGGTSVPNGRIIVSSLESVTNPNTTDRYRIAWQRCRGAAVTFDPQYGIAGEASGMNMVGMGPAGRQVKAFNGSPTIFVEVHFRYTPILFNSFAVKDYSDINSVAAMMVRDSRDLSQIHNTEGAPQQLCT